MRDNLLILFIVLIGGICSCGKGSFSPDMDNAFRFSTDTLHFDTVFVATGSVTRTVKIINSTNRSIRLSAIRLAGGGTSPFKLNINGTAGPEVDDESVASGDSLYIFVQVFVNPDNRDQPFLLEDSIEVSVGHQSKWLQLRAYGRNAVFMRDKIISEDTAWNSELPIVILGSMQIKTGVQLNMGEGTQVFVHAGTSFRVDGTLVAEGTAANPVIFTGDRLDSEYKNLPGSWPGILFSASSERNVLRHVVIKNAYQGIIAMEMTDDGHLPKVAISQSVIQNIADAGILAVRSAVLMENSLIANCGSNIETTVGGEYDFINCTIVAYGNVFVDHQRPVVQMSDHEERDGSVYAAGLQANLINCIIWGGDGNVDNEIVLNRKGDQPYKVSISHSIYKAQDDVANATLINSFLNADPLFDSVNVSRNIFDFHITKHPGSSAIRNGIAVSYPLDLDGKQRNNPPDIGCYEN